jgi:hypothetical protein
MLHLLGEKVCICGLAEVLSQQIIYFRKFAICGTYLLTTHLW